MADDNKKPGRALPRWVLFVPPAILAAIGAYLTLTRPAPNAAPDAPSVQTPR